LKEISRSFAALPTIRRVEAFSWMVDEADMCFVSAATVFATRHNFGLNLSP
jgi:hypothetical protein